MDILCGGCGRTLTVGDEEIGHDLPCPHCGRLIRMSAMAEGASGGEGRLLAPLEAEDDQADDFRTKAKLALKKKLLVVCGSCAEKLTVDQRLSGKVARCPSCGEQIHVPAMAEAAEPIEPTEMMAELEAGPSQVLDVSGRAPDRPPPETPGAWPAAMRQATAPTASLVSSPHRLRPRVRRRRSNLLLVLLLVSAGTGVGGILLGYLIGGRPREPAARPGQRPVDRPGPVRRDPWATIPDAPGPPATDPFRSSPGAGSPTAAPPPTPPPPAAPQPKLTIMQAGLDVLAGGGLIPAPAGKAFLLATVQIQAGSEPVTVDTDAGAVTVETLDGGIPTMGAPSPGGAFGVGGRRRKMTIPPTASRNETFLFVVPFDFGGGNIRVAGAGEAALPKMRPLRAPEKKQLPGTYGEAARFLKLSFRDPVMERLRTAPRHEVVIKAAKEDFDVAIPQTPLRGKAAADGGGSYKATLTDGAEALTGRLRLLPDGRHLVLYLADAPYHQVVYERR